ncbi:hypothetical protein ACFX5D_04165 [Flavobacterium sp. LB3P45]|uniref:Uncharacterized protein n=1 Tax=Flavobacterium fructosi TaxID=3230416 RepID=A0ABW6HKS1_9FLAO
MNLKILNYIRNKSQLQALFISQFPADYIRNEINAIIQKTRKSSTPGTNYFAKNISTLEVLIFIDTNGVPDGHLLSEELKIKLQDYRENLAKENRSKSLIEN